MKKRISDLLDGCEDDSVELFDSTPLSADRIRELTMSRISPKKKRPRYILRALAAAAACLGLVFLAGRAFLGGPGPMLNSPDPNAIRVEPDPSEESSVDVGDERPGEHCGDFFPSAEPDPGAESSVDVVSLQVGGDCCDMLPGGFNPVLCLNGTFYRWFGLNLTGYNGGYVDEEGRTHAATILPEGFEAVGEISVISHITEEEPGELEMKAGFDAAGTVFANPEKPAVVYVLMNTDWFADAYVRFTADYYESGLISFEGRWYWFAVGRGDSSEYLDELPEGCVSAGTLNVVSEDLIPSGNLEINCKGDTYDHNLGGREVFYDPADDSVIYVYEEQFWSGGSYPGWRACHIYSESTAQPTASDLWGEAAAQAAGK